MYISFPCEGVSGPGWGVANLVVGCNRFCMQRGNGSWTSQTFGIVSDVWYGQYILEAAGTSTLEFNGEVSLVAMSRDCRWVYMPILVMTHSSLPFSFLHIFVIRSTLLSPFRFFYHNSFVFVILLFLFGCKTGTFPTLNRQYLLRELNRSCNLRIRGLPATLGWPISWLVVKF